MFTGLTQHLATVVEALPQPPGLRLTIDAGPVADGAALGDSIAVNGCCLTVVERSGSRLAFEAGSETLSRTNLGALEAGDQVNLEPSLALGDKMGGHLVTGHIDAQGELLERREEGSWAHLKFSLPLELAAQVVGKGSIAVDGVSLTVVDCGDDWFRVALIPHTLAVTTLGKLRVGDKVNLETDLMAKYLQRQLDTRRLTANPDR